MLASFGVVTLFTNVPIEETLGCMRHKHKMSEHITSLAAHCLSNIYFVLMVKDTDTSVSCRCGYHYGDLESKALQSYHLELKLCVGYVDDTFVVGSRVLNHLNSFLQHLNGKQNTIKFAMEVEKDEQLPFLGVLVKMLSNETLAHTVYRKPTQIITQETLFLH